MSDRLFALNLLAAVSFGIGVGVIAAAATIGPHLAVAEGVEDDDLWGWDAQALEGSIDRDGRRSERRVERRRVVRRGGDEASRRERRSRRSYTAPILERDPFDTEDERGGCDGDPSASPESTAFPMVDGAREVPRAVLDWGLDNAAALSRSARFTPRFDDGGAVDAVVLAELPSGSLLGDLGLEAGDALLSLSGRDAAGGAAPRSDWSGAPPATIGLEIERGGATMTLRYRIVDAAEPGESAAL